MDSPYQLLVSESESTGSTMSDKAHRQMMDIAVKEAGRWSYGIKAIEVWQYTSEGRLHLEEGGAWVDPVYFQNEDPKISHALEKLYDSNSPDFMEQQSLAPGESLSGVLWAESYKPMASIVKLTSENIEELRSSARIQWRNVRAIAEDPDQPYSNRTKVIADAGFYYAAGIPFDVRGIKGLVVFMARESIKMQKMQSLLNVEYMLSVSDHIGSVLALREPRKFSAEQRSLEVRATFHKARMMIRLRNMFAQEEKKENKDEERIAEENLLMYQHMGRFQKKLLDNILDQVEVMKSFWKTWSSKMSGGGVLPPPGFSSQLTLFSFFVAFLASYVLLLVNTSIKMKIGNDLGFELNQIGSLTTMVYTLTAAPSAQPRTIMLGQMISMCVGILFSQLPAGGSWTGDEYDDPYGWFRVAGTVSISAAAMAYCGVAHPPGGALSVTFLGSRRNSVQLLQKICIILLQDSLIILLAAICNNMNSAKSYPTYWGHIPNRISSKIRSWTEKEDDSIIKVEPDQAPKLERRRSSLTLTEARQSTRGMLQRLYSSRRISFESQI